jgi:ketosteroid isomerase-like protein
MSCGRRPPIREQRTKNSQLACLASLAITGLFVWRPSLSATSADLAPAEAAVRKTDADWAAAATTASVDAWMAFYAADAIVLLPNDQLASGQELIRHSVSRLMAQSHLLAAWRPIKVEVARSGDLAYLIAAFELRFGDARGALVSDRGRRIEIWRRQADGAWKCIVDTWNLDEPVAAPPAVPPAQDTLPAAGLAAPLAQPPPLAQPAPPTPTAAPQFGPQSSARGAATKYGDMPTDYQEAIRKYFLEHLKHPESVQYREITEPEQGYTTAVTGTILMSEKRQFGWKVKATINAKNSDDSYVGFKTYTFLFRGEKIVDTRVPLPGGEMN